MNADELKKILDSLSPDARQVVDLYCNHNLTIWAIAAKLGYKDRDGHVSPARIYNDIGQELYKAFGIPKKENNKFARIRQIILEAEKNLPTTGQTKQGDSSSIKPPDTQNAKPTPDIPREPPVIKPKWLAIITAIVVLLVLGWIGGSRYLLPLVRSLSPLPTSRVTLESQSVTLESQSISSPTTSLTIFTDNFENGIKTEWNVINGTPGIVNGEFTSQSDTVWLSLALPSKINNYAIEADLISAGGCGSPGTIIAPVFVDLQNYIGFYATGCNQNWTIVTDGKKTDAALEHENKRGHHIKLTVQDGNVTLFIEGAEAGSVYNSSLAQGLIGVFMFPQVRIDNFSINSLP
jgi:hypothetical protein